jgi:hypothetical protein
MNFPNKILIIGNGPSTKQIDDFNKIQITSIGLNAAYKRYNEINWHPDYYCVFDDRLFNSHRQQIKEYAKKVKTIFSNSIIETINHEHIRFITTWHKFNNIPMSTSSFCDCHDSGATSTLLSMYLGSKEIYLIGMDANHIPIKESVRINNIGLGKTGQLRVTKEPEVNNNYWFDSYQNKGDVYNYPNPYVKDVWNRIEEIADKNGIKIFNCSNQSSIINFETISYKEIYSE